MTIYKLASVLLDYPSQELIENLEEIERRALRYCDVGSEEMEKLRGFVSYLRGVDLIDLQGEYVQTFDLTPDHSLHLTHHLCGDDRNRGPALVELSELYRRHGLGMPERELPDYLPLVLEFLHVLPPEEAADFLRQAGRVLVKLAANLEKADSPWQSPVRILAGFSGVEGDASDERPSAQTCHEACGELIGEEV